MTQIYVIPQRLITSGRVTIPESIREDLNLEVGDKVYIAVSNKPFSVDRHDQIQ